MKFGLDEYAHLDSSLHRWDPRYKLVGLLVLVFAFSAIRELRLVPLMFVITFGLFWLSRLPNSYLMTRLKLPGFFLLALVLILPFVSGQTELFRVGPLALRLEGIINTVLIASRFVCIITVSLILFGTAPFLTSIKAMRALKLPDILADMVLLTYRYLFEISDHLSTMRTAIRMRGFDSHDFSRRNLNILASLVGSLLVRSYEQSERVYKAMVLRGYGTGVIAPDAFQARVFDAVLAGIVIVLAVGILMAQAWLV